MGGTHPWPAPAGGTFHSHSQISKPQPPVPRPTNSTQNDKQQTRVTQKTSHWTPALLCAHVLLPAGVQKMEAEVVAMTLDMFHGTERCCGTVTSGCPCGYTCGSVGLRDVATCPEWDSLLWSAFFCESRARAHSGLSKTDPLTRDSVLGCLCRSDAAFSGTHPRLMCDSVVTEPYVHVTHGAGGIYPRPMWCSIVPTHPHLMWISWDYPHLMCDPVVRPTHLRPLSSTHHIRCAAHQYSHPHLMCELLGRERARIDLRSKGHGECVQWLTSRCDVR